MRFVRARRVRFAVPDAVSSREALELPGVDDASVADRVLARDRTFANVGEDLDVPARTTCAAGSRAEALLLDLFERTEAASEKGEPDVLLSTSPSSGSISSIEGARHTAIVVLTAAGGATEWKRLSEVGADAFLVKPVHVEDLELAIRRTVRARCAANDRG